ncbi:hypothetical protein B0T09DRAFT_336950 [Sordaria sp. MPI-SDFR-AT-0083]|nr:hypothetical protein B0T09DRAFT_336950 [Sordaria sp. MPI-SDFR-AT-0083]
MERGSDKPETSPVRGSIQVGGRGGEELGQRSKESEESEGSESQSDRKSEGEGEGENENEGSDSISLGFLKDTSTMIVSPSDSSRKRRPRMVDIEVVLETRRMFDYAHFEHIGPWKE